ncbi:hypothetical protein ABZP36_013584 [Zizania latifolia]
MGAEGDVASAAMRTAVKRLSFGTAEEKAEAAAEVGRLARSDERRKRLLPELGVVPPLVSMLADVKGGGPGARMAAAGALLELARGAHRNKVHILQAGLLKKLPLLMDDKNLTGSHQVALLLLAISSLANTDFPLASSEFFPFLVATLSADDVPADTKLSLLATLQNLSAKLEHVRDVVSSGAMHALLILALDRKTSGAALSILGDLAASAAGRKQMEEDEIAPRVLVEVMTWHESARCQEHATYLVMVLANGSGVQRRKMHQLGVVQVLLEVSLLGSPLAQKRAAKILQWFKDQGQGRIRAHSGPRMEDESCHGNDVGGGGNDGHCRNAVERIVKQSLDRNMKYIMRRATASVDLTNVKLLVESSSSKSLPC